jgi:hypothetical protein
LGLNCTQVPDKRPDKKGLDCTGEKYSNQNRRNTYLTLIPVNQLGNKKQHGYKQAHEREQKTARSSIIENAQPM